MNENAKHLIFRLGEETQHVIENIDDNVIETSLFSDQYKKALSSLDTYVSIKQDSKSELETDNMHNNIFAFIGDRGSGKTSCMMSLARLLKNGLSKKLKLAYPHINHHEYHQLKRIDPSFFDESHNVIELFLAELYNEFHNKSNENRMKSSARSESIEREVLELFSQAQKMMYEMTKTDKNHFDELDNLQNLSAGVKLGSIIKQLVDKYFSYLGHEDGILIIPIDDIDLNSQMAASMMEQIHKFLIQPNLIILLAVKIDQLELAKHMSLVGEYEIMIKNGLLNDKNVFNDMVQAYITKLLPHQQRIYMPDGSAYFNQKVEVVHSNGTDTYDSVRQMVPELICKKTRYVFYNTSDKTSYIVPSNLRELRYLIGLLYGMKDYWRKTYNNEEHLENNQYNKLLFKKYLYENWVYNNLNDKMQVSMREILNTQDAAHINAMVLACVKRFFSINQTVKDPHIIGMRQSELRRIFSADNVHYNIAIGDVLDILDLLENSETDIQKLKLIFLIRSFYSMRLYEMYDMSTTHSKSFSDNVLSKTRLYDISLSEYDKLVAGYYINSRISRLIPGTVGASERRADRVINFGELTRLINEVIKDQGKTPAKLQLVEFFLLGISRRFDTQDNMSGMQHRTLDSVFYAESLENLTKNAYFDVSAVLFNMTRIKACYERVKNGNQIYELAVKNRKSLFNRFIALANNRKIGEIDSKEKDQYNEECWLSYYCFRNAEIIKAFKEYVTSMKSPGLGSVNVIAKFFRRMSEFTIPFYDKQEDGTYKELDFKYLNEFAQLLEEPIIQNDFMSIFSRDYRPSPEIIDINAIVRGASANHNKIVTRLKRLYEQCPIIANYYQPEIYAIFDDPDKYMSRDDLVISFTILDDELKKYRHQ